VCVPVPVPVSVHVQALCFDCEEDMIEELSRDVDKFRGKVIIIRWGGGQGVWLQGRNGWVGGRFLGGGEEGGALH